MRGRRGSAYAALVRGAERWRGITVSEFERRQLERLQEELRSNHRVQNRRGEYLNDRQRPWAQAILRRAYQSADVETAQRLLRDLDVPSAVEIQRRLG